MIDHAHGGRFDGDAFFPLQVHGIEHLLGHVAVRNGACQLQHPVRQSGLAVIYMRDDTKIADFFHKRIEYNLFLQSVYEGDYPCDSLADVKAFPAAAQPQPK